MTSAGEWLKWALVFKAVFGASSGGITIVAGDGLSGGGFIPLGGSGEIALAAPGSTFVEVTGTSQNMSPNINYSANNAGLVTLTLPTTAALGDQITIYGKGAGGWKVSQGTGQQIIFGESASTVTTGSIQSTYRYDIVKLTCITANTLWSAVSESGNIAVT
jgi:hypothetical protein